MVSVVKITERIESEVATKIIPLGFKALPKKLSMIEFINLFPDNKTCERYLEQIRWSNSPACPYCGSLNVTRLKRNGATRFQCNPKICRRQFSVMVGTVFQGSHETLYKWFYLIYSTAVNKKNISSIQNSKNIGVTQSTLWSMSHKLRQLLNERETFKLSGLVEIDECFVSKSKIQGRWGAFSTRKSPILGMIERGGGRLKIIPIDSRRQNHLTPLIIDHVAQDSIVFTDSWSGYQNLGEHYNHSYVNHSGREFARGATHTNSIESIWGHFKKSIRGAHHSVSEKHLHLYCDEFVYKFNRRVFAPMDIFRDIIHRAVNIEPFISIAN